MNEKGKKTVVANIQPAVLVVTPYAMANISDDLFKMADNFVQEKSYPLAQYYVYCASIEVGLKSAILATDCSKEMKKFIKDMGHNLVLAHMEFEKRYKPFWDDSDLEVIETINPFFMSKGLEYFTLDVLGTAIRGFKELPEISRIASASQKVNSFIVANKLFFDAKTSQKPGNGLINLL